MNDLFPQLPEDLGALTREELRTAISERESALARCATGEAFADMETPPDRNERIALLQAGKDQLLALRAALEAHEAEDADFEADTAAILDEAGVTLEDESTDEPEAEPEPAEAEDETEAEEGVAELAAEAVENAETTDEPESQTAAAKQPRRYSTRPPATPKRHTALTVEGGAVLRATAGMDNVRAGTELDARALAELTAQAIRDGVGAAPGNGFKMRLATADWKDTFDDEFMLSPDNPFENQRKLDAVRGRQAIREINSPDAVAAAGGWCAPSTIRYDVGTMGTEERPVRDNLTTFGATRGGIRYFVDLSIAATDTTDGITRLTEAQDEGGTTTKDCVVIECPTDSEVRADVIASCLQAGNLAMIAFPELIEAWQNLLAVATARNADSGLLDAIADDAQTIEVDSDAVYGSFHSVARAFLKVAAGYRSRHRLGEGDPLMALAPAWLADNVVLDLVGRQFPWPQEVSRAGVAGLIERLTGVRVEWYLDSETGEGQIFGAQTEGALLDFPLNAVVYVYPPGGILHVDQGQLNIGLIRDSALTETNDVRFFSEFFEAAAVIAAEVFKVNIALCPSGAAPAGITAATCAAAS
jgi:hypothetical protein